MITRLSDQQLNNRITLFSNLHENKIIYRERKTAIVELKNLSLSNQRMSATAHVTTILSAPDWRIKEGIEDWDFGATWETLHYYADRKMLAVPYAGWVIWTDAEFVKKVEDLWRDGKRSEVMGILKPFR